MSEEHLAVDSACPPMKDGEVRLYGMRFCPFTQRVRIVLNAKNIPHNVVNINLKNQPEWYFKIHPDGKVPALDTGNEVVLESLDIADFLDEKFPDPPLYPNDPELKSRDKEFIKKFGKVVGATSRALHNTDNLPVEEYLKDILEPLEEFEAELTNRGTTFFGGDNPGMLDYIMWPWSERSKVPSALQDKEFHFQKEKFPTLVAWRDAMKDVNAVRDTITSLETHVKFLKGYSGANPEFDNL
ncbi:pyrimidodiazepine synthase-like isoform X2 [Zootermopsis nevadensis]|uniref:Glutathione S-transferase omega-1 n=1 Tax=Zootermopsis nevadensis TaxID=136037 RepID=A0A067RQG7_ZOONE|nr:pyrimidodiazepine synthase-like isoform X2 [Zootermopsis nevadensis]KDR22870.1 Glutathione S-transferase omega-1 [Zootermopsis nevadensis]